MEPCSGGSEGKRWRTSRRRLKQRSVAIEGKSESHARVATPWTSSLSGEPCAATFSISHCANLGRPSDYSKPMKGIYKFRLVRLDMRINQIINN